MNIIELRKICKFYGLSQLGRKNVIISRIYEYFNNNKIENDKRELFSPIENKKVKNEIKDKIQTPIKSNPQQDIENYLLKSEIESKKITRTKENNVKIDKSPNKNINNKIQTKTKATPIQINKITEAIKTMITPPTSPCKSTPKIHTVNLNDENNKPTNELNKKDKINNNNNEGDWTRGDELNKLLKYQYENIPDLECIFGPIDLSKFDSIYLLFNRYFP